MSGAPRLRRATAADADVLARGVLDGVADYPAFAPPGWAPPAFDAELAHLRTLLADARVHCLIAEADGRLAGQVTLIPAVRAPHPVADPTLAHISDLFIRREFWGTGLAAELLDEAASIARDRGFTQLRLFVASGQARARRFYEREGWSANGPEYHDPAPGLPMIEYRRSL